MSFDPSLPLRKRRNKCDPERFCNEVVAGAALYDAYVTAGFSRPNGNAERLERDPQVAARIDFLRQQTAEEDKMMLELRRLRMRCVLQTVIDCDRGAMYLDDGSLKPLCELTPEQRSLIESIEVTKHGVKVSMPPKLAAMAQLAKLEGLDAPEQHDLTFRHEDALQELE